MILPIFETTLALFFASAVVAVFFVLLFQISVSKRSLMWVGAFSGTVISASWLGERAIVWRRDTHIRDYERCLSIGSPQKICQKQVYPDVPIDQMPSKED